MNQYELEDREFQLFRDLIYRVCGISLSEAKRQLVQSRLQKRLRHYNLTHFRDYYTLLVDQGDAGPELGVFVNCLTTNKTDFFREKHHFDFVSQRILPELIARARAGERPKKLRVWHAGCSTGEEPYTMAMVLQEALQRERDWDVRLLASDIDTNVLAHAAAGEYDAERIEPVPETLRRKYLTRVGRDTYQVREDLRQMIAFRQINLLAETWPIRSDVRFDILFCRNVVIYFDKPTQRKLFARYEQKLRSGSYLFIGHSESLLGVTDSFHSLGNTIFQLPQEQNRSERRAA